MDNVVNWCAYCRMMTVTKTIKRPESYLKSFKKYIHVCSSCIDKNGLESIPEYKPTQLQKFVDHISHDSLIPSILKYNEKEYLILHDEHGDLLHTNELKLIAQELFKTVKIQELDQFIKKENQNQYMQYHFNEDPEATGKLLLPLESLRVQRKKFKSDKRWAFTCGNCSKKVSSKYGGEYFSMCPSMSISNHEWGVERACTKECMKVIAKDHLWNWITDNNYQEYFDIDNLDKKLNEYFKDI